jgi:hypothetical protein
LKAETLTDSIGREETSSGEGANSMTFDKINGMEEIEINKSSSGGGSKHLSDYINLILKTVMSN